MSRSISNSIVYGIYIGNTDNMFDIEPSELNFESNYINDHSFSYVGVELSTVYSNLVPLSQITSLDITDEIQEETKKNIETSLSYLQEYLEDGCSEYERPDLEEMINKIKNTEPSVFVLTSYF